MAARKSAKGTKQAAKKAATKKTATKKVAKRTAPTTKRAPRKRAAAVAPVQALDPIAMPEIEAMVMFAMAPAAERIPMPEAAPDVEQGSFDECNDSAWHTENLGSQTDFGGIPSPVTPLPVSFNPTGEPLMKKILSKLLFIAVALSLGALVYLFFFGENTPK